MKRYLTIVFVFILLLFSWACNLTKKPIKIGKPKMVLAIENQAVAVKLAESSAKTQLNGEILLNLSEINGELLVDIEAIRFIGSPLNTGKGNSGNLSFQVPVESIKSKFDPNSNSVDCQFVSNLHYPLIDQVMGYKPQDKADPENDVFVSYTEEFKGSVKITFDELPELNKLDSLTIIKNGAKVELDMVLTKEAIGEIYQFQASWQLDLVIFDYIYLSTTLKVQPIFIRYTPDSPCCCGGTTATTGGAFPILKQYSLEAWDRCCIRLDFLDPVYINNDDYRILASSDFTTLRDEHDDPDAIEVYFVETFDPVGHFGGGVCYSSGTANAKIITCDANLPINLYNLAHELGHALGLMHPGGFPDNSTSGSLMEPSGFCVDNPSFQSDENCDNADNPILQSHWWFNRICWRNTNMP